MGHFAYAANDPYDDRDYQKRIFFSWSHAGQINPYVGAEQQRATASRGLPTSGPVTVSMHGDASINFSDYAVDRKDAGIIVDNSVGTVTISIFADAGKDILGHAAGGDAVFLNTSGRGLLRASFTVYGDDGRNVLNHAMAEMTPSAWGICELVQLGGGIEAAASAEVEAK